VQQIDGILLEMPVFFCAGEPSGDVYAGLFIKELKKRFPEAKVFGVGGGSMRESGAEIVLRYGQLMSFGLADSISSFFRNYLSYKYIARQLYQRGVRTFVAVAYPGVNLLLCRIAKRLGLKVYYLLPPQIWAWGTFRKCFIKRWVDAVISVFPFETDFYQRNGINVVAIPNPILVELNKYKRYDRRKRIGFMPGSRRSHIRRNLPIILDLVRSARGKMVDVELCMIAYDSEQARELSYRQNMLSVYHKNRYQTMKNCDLLIVCSGTASLEAAAMKIPQIFFHCLSFFDNYVLRRFLHVREFNLANLYFGEEIAPCLVSNNRGFLLEWLIKMVVPRLSCRDSLSAHDS
jgi:lipid-A-disaccharide synthase